MVGSFVAYLTLLLASEVLLIYVLLVAIRLSIVSFLNRYLYATDAIGLA